MNTPLTTSWFCVPAEAWTPDSGAPSMVTERSERLAS